MSSLRISGLLGTAVLITIATVSAQQPPVRTPPSKPGDPKSANPKNNPLPPKLPPSSGSELDKIKWQKEVNGKNVKEIVKDMRTHPDPAVREASVRALPLFGPAGRKEGADDLVEAMSSKESDWNVRLAAVSVAPTVLIGLLEPNELPDPPIAKGLAIISSLLSSDEMQVRFDAVAAAGAIGPYMRRVEPRVISSLSSLARVQRFWQMRRAAVAALGLIGQSTPSDFDPDKKDPPDINAVNTLLEVLQSDKCAAVRREAVNSLIGVGPVDARQQKVWRAKLDAVLSKRLEKDKSVLLWVRVVILRNDPNAKGNADHLNAIADHLKSDLPGARLEGCQALGFLGDEADSKLQGLIHILNTETVPEVTAAAILAVAAMPSKSPITKPILQNMAATHKDENIRKLAAEALKALSSAKKK